MRDIEKHIKVKEFIAHFGDITCLMLSMDQKFIYSGSKDTKPKCWSIETGQVLETFRGHSGTVTCFTFLHHNFGKEYFLFTGSRDQTIRAWPINIYNLKKKEKEGNEKIESCMIS